MKKIGLLAKEKIVEEIQHRIKDTQASFFIGFNKADASSFNGLRNNLKKANTNIFISKNSLLHIAFKKLGWKDFDTFLDAETGIVFVYDKDVVRACKILVDFTKEKEMLRLKGGVLNEKRITPQELTDLAKLPSKEIILSMAVSGIASPITGFLTVLNQIILKFLWVVEEVKKKKVK